MAAIVDIEQITGVATPGSEVYTVKTGSDSGTRYYTADSPASGLATNPIPIPTTDGGVSGSYWVTHCLYASTAPSSYIKNVRYYQTWTTGPKADWNLGSSNSWPAGLYIGVSSSTVALARTDTQGFPSSSYARASGTQGTSGYLISGNHTWYVNCASPLSGGFCQIDDFDTVSNAFMVQSGNMVGATTGRSLCIVTQVLVGSGATQGEKTDKTATFVYSEV